jgi:hypothetical protein
MQAALARVLLPTASTEDFAGGGAGEFAVIVFDLTVDDGVANAFGELRRLREGGVVDNFRGIKDGDVGEIAGLEQATALEMFALRG